MGNAKLNVRKECGNSWTSLRGKACFFYKLIGGVRKSGKVCYYLCRQKCVGCVAPFFEDPIWYEDEVERVVGNLMIDVSSNCYEIQAVEQKKSVKKGRMRKDHDAARCEACQMKLCRRP